ncbi:MAG TPA: PrsW family glutamic-type intramembrane protease [Candidatus Gracilibacteria bacterium]|nr:PrsW family glutamic-type intramembrane protease [Candidatus Gracilibacteria bacterium]
MSFDDLYLYLLAGFLALIPAIIWLAVIFKNTKRKGVQILLFLGSVFSVVPVFLLQYFLNLFPQFDIAKFFESHIENQNINLIILFVCVGVVEELVKQGLVRMVDKKYLLIETINDSIRFSLIGALGFSFAENIFYIYAIYTQYGIQQLIVAYLFRSLFTTCAHLIFSGFFGYYYGIGKFSMNVVAQTKWTGKKLHLSSAIGWLMGISRMQTYKELEILKGLMIAIALHATFNFFLQLNQILPVAIYILAMGFLLRSLMKRKSGKLIMVTDPTAQRTSNMAQKDEDVVIELMGMWFKSKRYVDVLHICQRLLERDPDNKVVQMFKTQALDKIKEGDAYGKILQNIFPEKKEKSLAEMIKEKESNHSGSPLPAASVLPVKPPPKKERGFFELKLGV